MTDEDGSQFDDLAGIAAWLDEWGGVATLEAWEIRDAYGQRRLGAHVRSGITRELRGLGIAHYPVEFPDRGTEEVRLYKVNSGPGQIIEAVLSVGEPADTRLRETGGGDAADALARIREIVCD